MRSARELIAGLSTSTTMLTAAACVAILVGAVIAAGGWPVKDIASGLGHLNLGGGDVHPIAYTGPPTTLTRDGRAAVVGHPRPGGAAARGRRAGARTPAGQGRPGGAAALTRGRVTARGSTGATAPAGVTSPANGETPTSPTTTGGSTGGTPSGGTSGGSSAGGGSLPLPTGGVAT